MIAPQKKVNHVLPCLLPVMKFLTLNFSKNEKETQVYKLKPSLREVDISIAITSQQEMAIPGHAQETKLVLIWLSMETLNSPNNSTHRQG